MIKDLLGKFWVKGALIFGAVGFIISFLTVLLVSREYFPGIILRPLISAIVMSICWIALFFLVKKFVPDLLKDVNNNYLKNEKTGSTEGSSAFNEEFNFDLDNPSVNAASSSRPAENPVVEEDSDNFSENQKPEPVIERKKNPSKPQIRVGSDEMLVQGIPIKKDPELMARTIQHVLDTDKD